MRFEFAAVGDETQLTLSKKGKAHVTVRKLATADEAGSATPSISASTPAPATHDREKQRWIDIRRPFLVALGVTSFMRLPVDVEFGDTLAPVGADEIAAITLGEVRPRTQPSAT